MTFAELGITGKLKPGMNAVVCPRCKDSRKKANQNKTCLSVNLEQGNNWVKCHNCDFSMNLDLEEKYAGIRKAAGNTTPPEIYSPIVNEFLKKKGLSYTTAQRLLIYEFKPGVLAYPYYKGYSLVNVMFRDLNKEKEDGNKHTWQIRRDDDTPTESCYWGIDSIDWSKRDSRGRCVILITEGQTDRATWYECGYAETINVISVPMGAPSENAKNLTKELEYARYAPLLTEIEKHKDIVEIWIGVDEDPAGRNLMNALSDIYGKHLCRKPVYPEGYKDINEVFMGDAKKNLAAKGREGVERVFKGFKPFPVSGIITIDDVWQDILDYKKNGVQRGLLTSNKELNEKISFFRQNTWAITGNSGTGKSTWLRWYLVDLFKTNHAEHLGCALFSPEMMPPRREYTKLMEVYAQLPITSKNPSFSTMTDIQMDQARQWVRKNFIVANPTTMKSMGALSKNKPNTVLGILEYFKHLHLAYGTTINVIDAWNKLDHNRGSRSETDYTSEMLDHIIEFDAAYNTTTMIIAHPTKQDQIGGKYNNPNFPIPTLYNISGSAHFKNKVTVGLILDRKKFTLVQGAETADKQFVWEYNKHAPTHVKFEKIKFEEIGEEGHVEMMMDWARGETFTTYDPNNLKFDKGKKKPEQATMALPTASIAADVEDDDKDPF